MTFWWIGQVTVMGAWQMVDWEKLQENLLLLPFVYKWSLPSQYLFTKLSLTLCRSWQYLVSAFITLLTWSKKLVCTRVLLYLIPAMWAHKHLGLNLIFSCRSIGLWIVLCCLCMYTVRLFVDFKLQTLNYLCINVIIIWKIMKVMKWPG